MKINGIGSTVLGLALAVGSIDGFAGAMGAAVAPAGVVYIGVFGGGGASNEVSVNQYGTAFYTEAKGGPLAVNAFGQTNSRSVGVVGGQVGYRWLEIVTNPFNISLGLAPAVELEGYYLSKGSFFADDINNETTRLVEHDFDSTFPVSSGVFLVNAVLGLNPANFHRVHPYIGGGIGAALVSIANATAKQVAPPEPQINHFNSNPSDSQSAFAAQGKVGLSFDLSQNASVFVEYRGLFIASTTFQFGSTVYPGHPATSNWTVGLDSQFYNMGTIGLQLNV